MKLDSDSAQGTRANSGEQPPATSLPRGTQVGEPTSADEDNLILQVTQGNQPFAVPRYESIYLVCNDDSAMAVMQPRQSS